MEILNEFRTIDMIRTFQMSISRFGDGEFRLCFGRSAKRQRSHPLLQWRLRDILRSNLEHLLVGIPRIYTHNICLMPERKAKFWARYQQSDVVNLLDNKTVYGSAFITRPDSAPEIDRPQYFDMVKQIWSNRRVLIIQGHECGFTKDPSIFDNSLCWHSLCGPDYNAWDEYNKLLDKVLSDYEKSTIIILSLGPAATVMAYDLCERGYQALDLGHLGMFYNRTHPKSNHEVVNESLRASSN